MRRPLQRPPKTAAAEAVKTVRLLSDSLLSDLPHPRRKSGRTIEGWEQGRRKPDAFVLEAIRALAARRVKKLAARRAKT